MDTRTGTIRSVAAEGLGTAGLLVAVVGSGIMGARLSGGNVAIALLANSIATGAALVVLIATLAPLSGAHFNPVVTAVQAWRGRLGWPVAGTYIAAQILGGIAGVVIAHAMFGEPLIALSHHVRGGTAQIFSEAIATCGLLLLILGNERRPAETVAAFVGLYIMAAYWFTSSTSFANPAATFARALTDTFTGIAPASIPGFLMGQAAGAIGAVLVDSFFRQPSGGSAPISPRRSGGDS
ncbi:MAG: MIP/aquaporin family protein [Hyphomicrobiales bacterium]